jgi:hypothetical protein
VKFHVHCRKSQQLENKDNETLGLVSETLVFSVSSWSGKFVQVSSWSHLGLVSVLSWSCLGLGLVLVSSRSCLVSILSRSQD